MMIDIYSPITITQKIIDEFEPTRLAIKELAGKLYFCKSTKPDFIKYVGSGVYWLRRVKKYGRKNVRTLWVSDWYHCPHELQKVALDFSRENEIVESDKWANMKPENGIDGNTSGYAKAFFGSPERRKATSDAVTGVKNPRYDPTIYSFTHADGRVETLTKMEFRKKYPEMTTGGVAALISGRYKSDRGWRLSSTPIEETGKKSAGRKNVDKNLYEFVHTDGRTEVCSRAELTQKYSLSAGHVSSMINGKSKYPHKGWTLKK